jgi:hypothetical protein
MFVSTVAAELCSTTITIITIMVPLTPHHHHHYIITIITVIILHNNSSHSTVTTHELLRKDQGVCPIPTKSRIPI